MTKNRPPSGLSQFEMSQIGIELKLPEIDRFFTACGAGNRHRQHRYRQHRYRQHHRASAQAASVQAASVQAASVQAALCDPWF